MRRHLFILVVVASLLVVGCRRLPQVVEMPVDSWQFEYAGSWFDAKVPGCIHTDLLSHGMIQDPFYGTNEDSVQWVSGCDWSYRCQFQCDKRYRHYAMVFEGLDTYADIYLNDSLIAQSHNMYVPCVVDIPTELLSESNTIMVTFHPTAQHDSAALAQLPYDVPDHRVFTRKPPYQQGWDWGPKLNTCGICRPVSLIAWNNSLLSSDEAYESLQKEPRYASLFPFMNVCLKQEQDSVGQSFTFMVDGKPFFVKGVNWIPPHSFPIVENEEVARRYRYLLCSAKESHIDMIRVWGGGIYEPELFYDLCDSLGIMVWQDFMFSCAFYPDDEDFYNNVRREAVYQVKRLAKHPCVVLFCGNNEVKNGWEDWGWQEQYGYSKEQQERISKGIDRLFGEGGLLDSVVHLYGRGRQYITTSPLYGWGHPECVTHGDSHYWGVWWGELPFEMYAEKTGRFMSEYGFQSYPDWSSILRFCPEEQLDINSPTMRNHQKHGRGVQIIDKAMREYYGVDSKVLSLEDYCYVSQLLQAWGIGYGIFYHYISRPHCMGTLYWQLNDCWPVASWSSIDYYGNWKALQYRVKDMFTEFDEQDCHIGWKDYYGKYPKDRRLKKAEYEVSVDARKEMLKVSISAKTELNDVFLQTVPHIDGHFEWNYFDMDSGDVRNVRFIPFDTRADLSGVTIKVKTLNDIYQNYRRK